MKFKSLLFGTGLLLSQLIFASLFQESKAITLTAVVRGNMPTNVAESSGLEFNGGNDYWSLNDAGGSNKIYRVNATGVLKQTVTISNATDYDWEDLTHNPARTSMFIGDFGNNYHDRHNLKIYKIPYPNSSTITTTATVINFSYPDQHKFPSPWKNFDVEGFFYLNNKLFLFTKGEGSAAGYTKMYTLPDSPGTYVATLVDSFYVNGRITSAAISPDNKSVVLITNTMIHLFRNFPGNNIFDGTYYKITIAGTWTQKEGVSFSSNTLIYLSDEGAPGRNHLYTVDLSAYMISPRLAAPEDADQNTLSSSKISAYPNPANSFINFQCGESFAHADVMITNLSGQVVKQISLENTDQDIRLETDMIPDGFYAVRIIGDNRKEMSVMITISR